MELRIKYAVLVLDIISHSPRYLHMTLDQNAKPPQTPLIPFRKRQLLGFKLHQSLQFLALRVRIKMGIFSVPVFWISTRDAKTKPPEIVSVGEEKLP